MRTVTRLSALVLAVVVSALTCPTARSQTLMYTFDGDFREDLFGSSVSNAGDVNNDGFADVIVGARWSDCNGTNSGMARVFGSPTG